MQAVTRMFAAVLAVTPWTMLLFAALLLLRTAAKKWLSPRFFQLAFLVLALRLALPVDLSLPDAPVQLTLPAPPPVTVQARLPELPLPEQSPARPLRPQKPELRPAPPAARPRLGLMDLLPALWLGGAVTFFALRLGAYGVFIVQLRRSRTPAAPPVLQQAEACFGRPVRVYNAPGIASPMLVGLVRPVVYLPEEGVGPDALPFVLAHEACHCRRHDLPAQFLLLAAQSVHWFDPMVHWMALLCRQDMERGCDEAVLSGRDLSYRKAYGSAVLATLRTAHARRTPTLSTGFSAGSDLKRRFTDMFDFSKKSRGLPLLAALLALVLAASSLVACGQQEQMTSSTVEPPLAEPAAASAPESLPAAALAEEQSAAVRGGDWGWPLPPETETTIARVMDSVHKGMDIAAPEGTPIHSLLEGTVVTSGEHYAYGNYVVIQDDAGRRTLYAHCKQRMVQEGDRVTPGQTVATVGKTGNATGFHLHVECYRDDQRLPPRTLLTLPETAELPPPEFPSESASELPEDAELPLEPPADPPAELPARQP